MKQMLLVVPQRELPETQSVWGTGGWLPPEEREGLDWLALSKLLGWSIAINRWDGSSFQTEFSEGTHWIVLACDSDALKEAHITRLIERLETEPILLVVRAGSSDALSKLTGVRKKMDRIKGRRVTWEGPGPQRFWTCRTPLEGHALECPEESDIWATLEGNPFIVARRFGVGFIATLGFHPSQARDTDGTATALLKQLLIQGVDLPLAWLDYENTVILRMDDPGSAETVHHQIYSQTKLESTEWNQISSELEKRNARLSVGYVAGWVDDGDPDLGNLKVSKLSITRIPGKVYPSPLVVYEKASKNEKELVFDYEDEYNGIQTLRAKGVAEVELHGHTHMHPDSITWAKASDRYSKSSWYRELGKPASVAIASKGKKEHPLTLGLSAFRQYFNVTPTTVICPGEQFTSKVLQHALDLGFSFVGSYYLALRYENHFCWAQHVCAPYLNQPDHAWFDAGLPVVGYFHDFDLKRHGVQWFSHYLKEWEKVGARKWIDYRELAGAISRLFHLTRHSGQIRLTVRNQGAPQLVRPLTLMMRIPGDTTLSHISVSWNDQESLVETLSLGHDLYRITLPGCP